jgi:hypothetical protein
MTYLSIHDLHKVSGEMIGALPGPTAIKSSDRTIGLLVPLKAADPDRLAAVLAQAKALAKGRNRAEEDAALALFGEVDPIDWSVEAVRALRSGGEMKKPSSTIVTDAAAPDTAAMEQVHEFALSVRDSEAFVDALLNPRPVNDHLRDTISRYRERIHPPHPEERL